MHETRTPIVVRWLLAHEPASLFARSTEVFKNILEKESGGTMTLTVLDGADLGYEGDVPTADVFTLMDRQKIELSSTLVTGIAQQDPSFNQLNLPFLFNDYQEAFAFLDGPDGTSLLASLASTTPARGLAFTLSGGFRVLASHDKLFKGIGDFRGARIVTTAGITGEDTWRAVDATPVSSDYTAITSPDAVEVTYTRISSLPSQSFIRYITETNHSIFLTAMIVRTSFYDALTPRQQEALQKAAVAAAHAEREDSLTLAEEERKTLINQGVTISDFPEQAQFYAATQELRKNSASR